LLQVGQTKVITQSQLKIISPKPGKPNEGEVKFNVEFASLQHSAEYN
jgi:exosome complex component RRP45